jgi:uncharacterized protein YicC (UPF0701 family)
MDMQIDFATLGSIIAILSAAGSWFVIRYQVRQNGKTLDEMQKNGSTLTQMLEQRVSQLEAQIKDVGPTRLDQRVATLETQFNELAAKVDNLGMGQQRMEGKLDIILGELKK